MHASSEQVLELVVFSLRAGVPRERLVETAGAVSAWVAEQPGFVSRELFAGGPDGRWIDSVRWTSLGDAHAAAEAAMTSESCAPMFALIDMESMLMLHGELIHAAP